MILFDASALLATGDPDSPQGEPTRALLRSGRPAATIDLAAYEITNVAARQWRDHAAGQLILRRIWAIEQHGRLVRIDAELAASAADLAEQHGLTAYDAAYVAAARLLGATLVSCDVKDLVEPGFAVLPGDA